MKITKQYLQQIIKEETQRVMQEVDTIGLSRARRVARERGTGGEYEPPQPPQGTGMGKMAAAYAAGGLTAIAAPKVADKVLDYFDPNHSRVQSYQQPLDQGEVSQNVDIVKNKIQDFYKDKEKSFGDSVALEEAIKEVFREQKINTSELTTQNYIDIFKAYDRITSEVFKESKTVKLNRAIIENLVRQKLKNS